MVNLEWFRTFKTVYETGSLTAAANKLFISQPGVSLHLSSLESFVNNKLFDRGPRKLVPTEHGKILYNSIVDAVKKMESVENRFCKSSEVRKNTISIGMCFETFQIVLEPYISELSFNLISKFGDYPHMLNDLDKGILDFVITPHIDESYGNISYKSFSSEKLILISGAKSEVDSLKKLLSDGSDKDREMWLNQQLWFGTTGDMEHLRNFWLHNFNKRPEFKPNYIVPNLNSIVRCISNREGFAVMPEFLCRSQIESGEIQLVWEGKSPLTNILYFAQRKKTIYNSEISILQDIFRKELVQK